MDDVLDFDAIPSPPSFDFAEYESPHGDKWRVERGASLIIDFELDGPEQLPTLHGALAGQDPTWTILRRLYAIAPLMGVENPDELRVWPREELAAALGIEPQQIDGHVTGAKTFWRRWQLENSPSRKNPEPVRVTPAIPSDEAEQLLREQGFVSVEEPDERAYIATRIKELAAFLESDNHRASARSVIQQEVTIFFALDPSIRGARKRIRELLSRTPVPTTEKESKQLLELVKARNEAQEALERTMKSVGLTDAQGGGLRKKMGFTDCLAELLDAFKKYYSNGDRTLIDSIFTAAEVELLITPTTLRPMQYRADLTLAMLEAGQPENLWNSEYVPTKLSRQTCRKLARGFSRGLEETRGDGSDTGEVEETDENLEADSQSDKLPSEAVPVMGPGQSNSTTPPPRLPRASKNDATAVMGTS